MNIGVGTPSRIVDLLIHGWSNGMPRTHCSLTHRLDELSSDSLERVVIDCSFLDQKKRSILDMKETQQPLMQLLNREELKPRYSSAQAPVKLVFYQPAVQVSRSLFDSSIKE